MHTSSYAQASRFKESLRLRSYIFGLSAAPD
jgi:hypothetical protein